MRRVMVRYKVRPEQAATNEELVRAVYDELADSGLTDLRYATFVLDDGISFVHLHESEDGVNTLPTLETFKRFQEGVRERCEEQPVVSELRQVGAFRMFSG
jgi:hypothetical protein